MPAPSQSWEFGQILDSRGSRTYQAGLMFGLAVGAVLVLIGASLCVAGFSGSIEWILSGKGWGSKLANASPGVFFSLFGFVVLVWYKHQKIKIFAGNGLPTASMIGQTEKLRKLCTAREAGQVVGLLRKLVPEYSPSTQVLGLMDEPRPIPPSTETGPLKPALARAAVIAS